MRFQSIDLTSILLALFVAVPATITALVGLYKVQASVKKVHAEVRTNNGRTNGEYTEQMSVKQDVQTIRLRRLAERLDQMEATIVAHTKSDTENFAAIMEALREASE